MSEVVDTYPNDPKHDGGIQNSNTIGGGNHTPKNQYGGNDAQAFIDDYFQVTGIVLPPKAREALVLALIKEETEATKFLVDEIEEKGLKDEPQEVFAEKLTKRITEYIIEEKSNKSRGSDDESDLAMYDIAAKEVAGVDFRSIPVPHEKQEDTTLDKNGAPEILDEEAILEQEKKNFK